LTACKRAFAYPFPPAQKYGRFEPNFGNATHGISQIGHPGGMTMRSLKTFSPRIAGAIIAAFVLTAAPAHAQNLVVNGDFETGDLSGWVAPEESYPEYATDAFAHGGAFSAQIAGYSYDPDTLSQQIETTAGRLYRIKVHFHWDSVQPGTDNLFAVQWSGSELFRQQNIVDDGSQWHLFSGYVTGSGSDTLRLIAANDPGYLYVDDISVAPVPEPASWAMMLAGFGAIGGALRTRRRLAFG
jgi:hypothetical protein